MHNLPPELRKPLPRFSDQDARESEIAKRMNRLREFCQVPDGDWYSLARILAAEVVPGLSTPGRENTWIPYRLALLQVDFESLIERGHTVESAARKLAAMRNPDGVPRWAGWKHVDPPAAELKSPRGDFKSRALSPKTLVRRYREAVALSKKDDLWLWFIRQMERT